MDKDVVQCNVGRGSPQVLTSEPKKGIPADFALPAGAWFAWENCFLDALVPRRADTENEQAGILTFLSLEATGGHTCGGEAGLLLGKRQVQ